MVNDASPAEAKLGSYSKTLPISTENREVTDIPLQFLLQKN